MKPLTPEEWDEISAKNLSIRETAKFLMRSESLVIAVRSGRRLRPVPRVVAPKEPRPERPAADRSPRPCIDCGALRRWWSRLLRHPMCHQCANRHNRGAIRSSDQAWQAMRLDPMGARMHYPAADAWLAGMDGNPLDPTNPPGWVVE